MASPPDPIDTLKGRLAAGELSVDEYHTLFAIIQEGDANSTLATSDDLTKGKLLAEVDNVRLFEHSIVADGVASPLADVVSVSGTSSSTSINFIPMDKRSSVGFTLLSGKSYWITEDRALFGSARHAAIRAFFSALRQATFSARFANLVQRLVREGRLEIFRSYTGEGEPVFLSRDGALQSGTRVIDLKTANAAGTFAIGVEQRSLGQSRAYNTEEVVVSEKRGTLGLLPFGALRFTPNVHNTDVVNALLSWLAKPDNKLTRDA